MAINKNAVQNIAAKLLIALVSAPHKSKKNAPIRIPIMYIITTNLV